MAVHTLAAALVSLLSCMWSSRPHETNAGSLSSSLHADGPDEYGGHVPPVLHAGHHSPGAGDSLEGGHVPRERE